MPDTLVKDACDGRRRGTAPSRFRSFLTLASATLAMHASMFGVGCSSPRATDGDLTGVAEQIAVLSRQSTPTEIQASVMAFADLYSSRTADVFDRVHEEAQSPGERVNARRAKVAGGLGAITIAAEVNPVAAMVDMVTMVRIKQRSFRDQGASSHSPEQAQLIQAMHDQSEEDVWLLAGRFLSDQQRGQLREVIDEWYDNNPDVRTASYVRLQDFAEFRRESPWRSRAAPASVLRMLHIDPLAGLDPVAREIQESRMLAERAMFFAKRIPPLASWQMQLATADLLAKPELRDLLLTTERLSASAARIATTGERVATGLDRMPQDVDRIVAGAIADIQHVLSAERSTAIEQASAVIDAHRAALMRDVDGLEGRVRGMIADVNKTLVEARSTVSAVGGSAQDAVASAHLGVKDAVDHLYHRLLILLLLLLIGIPAAMILYRSVASRMFGARPPHDAPHA